MASGDAERRITLRALYDDTQLKKGTEESEQSIKALADQVDSASDDMRRSLQSIDDGVSTTFGPSGTFAHSVDDVETEGNRLKESGKEIGAEFNQNLASALASGDIATAFTDTIANLGQVAGVAGIGAAIGGTLLVSMIKGAQARRQAFVDEVDSIFESLNVKAQTTGAQIAKQIMQAYSFKKVLQDIGGGDELVGMEKINQLSAKIGVNFNDIVDILRGKMTPESANIIALLQQETDETVRAGVAHGSIIKYRSDEAGIAQEILDTWQLNVQKQQEATELALRNRDYLRQSIDPSQRLYDNMSGAASAAERFAAAAERWAGRRLPDPTKLT